MSNPDESRSPGSDTPSEEGSETVMANSAVSENAVTKKRRQLTFAPSSHRRWVVPVGLLVLGLGVGVLGGWALRGNGHEVDPTAERRTPNQSVQGTASARTPTGTATSCGVPPACGEVGAELKDLQRLLSDIVDAAQQMDAGRLSGLVRQMDDQQRKLADAAQRCSGQSAGVAGSVASST